MPDTQGYSGSIVGRRLGHYRLTQRIGEGGMGEVYLAEREDEFRKRVAVKLIRQGASNPEIIRRFLIERQTLAALNHPNIVRLVDGGATEDGLPYLIVDYVEGVAVDRYCEDHHLNITARLKLFLDVCLAVQYAHQNMVVHCDLKPSNILVTPEGTPMLLDFGIAKLLDPVSIGITAQAAQTRQRAFTPDYASPEQLRGQPVTTASDVYALGVILYDLLTGHSPYPLTSGGSLADWIRCVCERDAEPPSTVIHRVTEIPGEADAPGRTLTPEKVSASREGDAQSLRRRLRGDLDAIVLKALRKEPRDRYSSVEQMAEDIRRHLSGRPVQARKSSTAYVVRKFAMRNKLALGAAAVVLVTLVGGLASTLWQARVAARRFDEVRHLARTFLFDVHDSIQDLPGSTPARSLIAKTGTEYLDRLARDAGKDLSLQLELADGYLKIGDVQGNPFSANLGDLAAAVGNYRKALTLAESAAGQNASDPNAKRLVARGHEELANVLPFNGKAVEGLDHAGKAILLRKELLAAAPDNAEAKLDLARAYETEGDILGGARGINLGRAKEAVAAYERLLTLIPTLPANHRLHARAARAKAIAVLKLGDMRLRSGDIGGALSKYETALRTAEDLSRADTNNARARDLVSNLLNKMATAESSVGNDKVALAYYVRANESNEAALRADPRNEKARTGVLVTQKNLGDLYFYNLRNMPEALRCYQRVVELLEIQSQADPGNFVWRQNLAETLTYVASGMLQTGQPAEARRQAQRGLDIAKEVADRPGASGDQVYNYAWLAVTVEPTDLQKPAAALPYALKAVAMSKSAEPLALHVLAQAYAGMGDFTRAVQTEEKALALFPPIQQGKPVPSNQATVERYLAEYRAELKKRPGGR